MDVRETVLEDVDLIHLNQNWRALVNTVKKTVSTKVEEFLDQLRDCKLRERLCCMKVVRQSVTGDILKYHKTSRCVRGKRLQWYVLCMTEFEWKAKERPQKGSARKDKSEGMTDSRTSAKSVTLLTAVYLGATCYCTQAIQFLKGYQRTYIHSAVA